MLHSVRYKKGTWYVKVKPKTEIMTYIKLMYSSGLTDSFINTEKS